MKPPSDLSRTASLRFKSCQVPGLGSFFVSTTFLIDETGDSLTSIDVIGCQFDRQLRSITSKASSSSAIPKRLTFLGRRSVWDMIPRDHSEEMTASVAASHGRHHRQHARLRRATAINICGFTSRTFHKTFRTIFVNEQTFAEHQHEQFHKLKFHAMNRAF